MNKWIGAIALLAFATTAQSQSVPAAAPIQIEPAGPWKVEYADSKCLLHRNFSSEGKRTLLSLSIEPLTPVAWLKIAVEGTGGRRADGDAIMFADGQRRAGTLHYNIYGTRGYRMREFMLDLDRHDLGAVEDRIRFWTKTHGDLEVRVSGFASAWKALQSCMDDLHTELGIDGEVVARMAKRPEGQMLAFLDLPRSETALDFAVLYWVTAEGRVDDCRLVQPSGIGRFDQSLCSKLLAKARFKPALDAAGDPLRVPQFENVSIRMTSIITAEPMRTR